jgi:antitoxin component of MazEF toxin-antitoxin module
VKRWGASLAVILPLNMRQALNIGLGDIIAVRVQPPYAVLCVWPANAAPKIEHLDTAKFPPCDPELLKNA